MDGWARSSWFLAFGGRFPCKSILRDSLESQAVILLARADGAGDLRCVKTYLGRVIRDIERRIIGNEVLREAFVQPLSLARRVLE
jgi:hypothetical protein